MKKTILIFVCVFMLLVVCGCETGEQSNMEIEKTKQITFINELNSADVWILPQTDENLKTTVWGTAIISKAETGLSRQAMIPEPSEDGLYIFRMIDNDHFYYSANGLTIETGWTVKIKGEDLHSITIEVTDENGTLQKTYEVFVARL